MVSLHRGDSNQAGRALQAVGKPSNWGHGTQVTSLGCEDPEYQETGQTRAWGRREKNV